MAKNASLTKMLLGGAALIAAGTAAQAMSLGSTGCVLGGVLGGPVGAAIGALAGFGSSFAGGWMSNRFHEKYKALEYELNDPSDVLRNHYLRRLVSQAIRLSIRQAIEGSIKDQDTIKALRDLETLAVSLFERDSRVADTLNLNETQVERFFTGRWADLEKVDTPDSVSWRAFLEEATGTNSGTAMTLAVGIAAETLSHSFARLLLDNAKLASENDKPAYAALELMLVRALANTLADHGQQLTRIDASTTRSEAELIAIKAELASLRESLATLPTRLESRLVLPDLQSLDSLRVSAHHTGLILPRAVASLDARLASIEALLRATYEGVKDIGAVQRGDRKLLAHLPLVGESIRDNANRDWTIRELLSSGAAGCVALAEHRGKFTVFKLSIIEEFARSFAREVEAATTLQDIPHDHARFCKILDSKLPLRPKMGSAIAEAAVLPPYWIQLEHFPLGNLAIWWKAAALTGPVQADSAATLVADIARTAEIAHGQRVLHRDLKPANILMRESRPGAVVPHVSDFGIASFADPDRSAALHEHAGGRTIHTKGMDAASHQGTLLYMAPELYERSADNRPTSSPSARTDVYSLGMILYWLLTGRQERPSRELVQAHVSDRVLGYVIRRATHREPERRYASAAALAVELDTRAVLIPALTELEDALLSDVDRLALEKERLQASEAQRARAEEQSARALRLVGRLRWAAAGLVMLAALATLGFVIASQRAEGERLAKVDADQKRQLADRETERAKSETAKAEEATAHAERQAYFASVIGAGSAIEADDWIKARALLVDAPKTQRNWEFGYFDAQSDTSLVVLIGHQSYVFTAVFSSDGTKVVTASADKTARVWDAGEGKEVAVLRGHEEEVITAALSPDGSRVLTASWDGSARVWDAATGIELVVLRGHTQSVRTATFSADGARVVTASGDKTARVWNSRNGEALAVLRGHKSAVVQAVLSLDGTRVATVSEDKTARVWDAETGREVATFQMEGQSVDDAAFSPDGAQLVIACGDNIARVYDATNAKEIAVLRGHTEALCDVAFSQDGTRVITASFDTTARVWDANTGDELVVLRGHQDWVYRASFDANGVRAVTASADKTARVWDLATATEVAVMRGHSDRVLTAAFSPDGNRVVTASVDRTSRVWDAVNGKQSVILSGHWITVHRARFSPDGTRVATASRDRTARVWDVATGQEVTALRGHDLGVFAAEWSKDSTRIVTASPDKTARVWDPLTGRELVVLRGHEGTVEHAHFSPDGELVLTASSDKTARIWDSATGRELFVLLGHTDRVTDAVFSPNGSRVLTASADKTARVWDAGTGNQVAVLSGHNDGLVCAAWSSDGNRIVTGAWDKTARVWDAKTWKELAVMRGHEEFVGTVAFSHDGNRLLTSSADKTARVWEVETGTKVSVLRGHEASVFRAAMSPDGTRVATGSIDKTARIWDLASGRELAVLRGHTAVVQDVAFSPDGTRVATASGDGTARLWDSVSWRDRYPAIARARAADARLAPIVTARLSAGEAPEALRAEFIGDSTLTAEERTAALSCVQLEVNETAPPNPDAELFNNAARLLVTKPDASPDDLANAVKYARLAVETSPKWGPHVNTLGIALYKSGQYKEAIEMLLRSQELQAQTPIGPLPSGWAYIAMAYWRLDQRDDARAAMAKCEAISAEEAWRGNAAAQGFLQEAKALITPTP